MARPRKKAQPTASPLEGLFPLCWQQVQDHGIGGLQLTLLAPACGVTIEDLYRAYPTPLDLIEAMTLDRVQQSFDRLNPDDILQMTRRDRLFEVIITFIEDSAEIKPALGRLHQDLWAQIWMWPGLLKMGTSIAAKILDFCAIETKGTGAQLALSGALGYILFQWLNDDTPDISKTLVAIDQALDNLKTLTFLA